MTSRRCGWCDAPIQNRKATAEYCDDLCRRAARRAKGRSAASKHRLSPGFVKALLVAQRNLCAICEQPETALYQGKVRVLAVDHDHRHCDTCAGNRACGEESVRGLLCFACNHRLGRMCDGNYLEPLDAEWSAAAAYIRRYRSRASARN